jgi:hypothetical protein
MAVTEYAAGAFTPFAVSSAYEQVVQITDPGVYVAFIANDQLTGSDEFRFVWRTWDIGLTHEITWPDPPIEMGIPSGDGEAPSGIALPPIVVATDQPAYLRASQPAGSSPTEIEYVINQIA